VILSPRHIYRRLRAWRYWGHQFQCPCCGYWWREFLPAGVKHRPNAQCPVCGSLERHRLIWLYLRDQTDLFTKPYQILDIAPEEFLSQALNHQPNIKYLSVDLDSPRAMRKMDITKMDFPDNSFDVIFCNHVFEHVPDDRAAMHEVYRVLKPGGWAILQTPIDHQRSTTDEDPTVTDPGERERRFGQRDHVRVYGLDLFERLASVGWSVRRISYARELGPAAIGRYALTPNEEIIRGTKAEG